MLGTLATSFTWRHALDGLVDGPPTYNSRGNPRRCPTRNPRTEPTVARNPLLADLDITDATILDQVEVHPDGLIVNGTTIAGVTVISVHTDLDPDRDGVQVDLTISLFAKTAALSAAWFGDRPEPPVFKSAQPVDL
jgi:hypothetical protein